MKAHVPAPARRVLIQFVVLALAAGDAVGSLLAEEPPRYAVPLAVIAVGVLPFRNKMPYLALALTLPGLIFDVTLAPLIALYTVAERRSSRYALVLCIAAFFVCYASPWDRDYSGVSTILSLVYAIVFSAAPVWLGLLIRARAALSDKLAEIERARAHEEELLVQQAITQERTALAREMHDVISHKVSLIAVQAGALQVTSSDPASAETARTIRALSVRTLDELREMVGVLRPSATHEIELAPQPSIDDLPHLIETSGIDTTINIVDTASTRPSSSVQRALYRTVQEGLTNIAKHAPGAQATMDLWITDDSAELRLTNSASTRPPEHLPSSHHGLLGLRERAELLGGSIRSHGTSDGGFELVMSIPLQQ